MSESTPKCSCGRLLHAFVPDEADLANGGSVPCYSSFSRYWLTEPGWGDDPSDAAWIAEREAEFEGGGLYAANEQDAIDYGVNRREPEHDVYSCAGMCLFEAHTS